TIAIRWKYVLPTEYGKGSWIVVPANAETERSCSRIATGTAMIESTAILGAETFAQRLIKVSTMFSPSMGLPLDGSGTGAPSGTYREGSIWMSSIWHLSLGIN